jgi:hypothetical protein
VVAVSAAADVGGSGINDDPLIRVTAAATQIRRGSEDITLLLVAAAVDARGVCASRPASTDVDTETDEASHETSATGEHFVTGLTERARG